MTGHRPQRTGGGSGWGTALRIARREMLRAKGRSLLVLLMVLLPLTAVVGLDTLLRTGDVSAVERLPGELGGAQARIVVQGGGPVAQDPEGEQLFTASATRPGPAPVLEEADVRERLPRAGLLVVREARGERAVRTADGRTARVSLLGADLSDPALRGPYRLLRGQAPAAPQQVAVTPALERFGFPVGSRVRLPGGGERVVSGVVRTPDDLGVPSPETGALAVLGLPEAVGLAQARPVRYYASGPEVTWADVQALNALGAVVLSRAVVLDPPPDEEVPRPYGDGQAAVTAAVIGLIAVIAVLEVVLLAGPAFAVGARRQRRALALMAAGGAEPRHVRRVVLAQGLLVGGTAAVLALVLGIGGAALLRGPLTRYADARWGPFEVSVRDLALLCLLGAGTALLAALAPAVLAARQPVVAALQGRRVAPGRTWLPTAVGVVLLVVGVLSCARSLDRGFPELWVAAAAVPTVLGAAALAPVLLAAAGRLAPRLPLPLRFAVRDADRQRSRTAPAVAAVTAVVAGVVALATAVGSDRTAATSSYTPVLPGTAVVSVHAGDADMEALAAAARAALPGEPVSLVRGILLVASDPRDQRVLNVCRPSEPAAPSCNGFGVGHGQVLGSTAVVGPQALPVALPGATASARARAERDLAAGRVLVAGAPPGARVELRLQDGRYDEQTGQERSLLVREVAVQAAPLPLTPGTPPAAVVLPEEVAQRLGGAAPVSVLVGTDLGREQEERLQRAVRRVDTGAWAHVERPPRDETGLVVLLLGLAAGALVVGGSLAATSLALTEARPDLTTLGQVGAHPRVRRLVAASYGFVLALVGALLGGVAGLVPGVAGAVALNRGEAYVEHPDGRFVRYGAEPLGDVDVPWLLLLGLVAALPLLTGLVAGLTTRSALPGLGRRVRA